MGSPEMEERLRNRFRKRQCPQPLLEAGNIFRASGLRIKTTVSCEYWVTGSHRSAQFAAGFVLRMLCILPTFAGFVCRRNGRFQASSACRGQAAAGAPLLTLSPSFLRSPQNDSDDTSVRPAIIR
jgi:hypothetical protein